MSREMKEVTEGTVELRVQNIGGITETSVEFTPGVIILTGRNATNRTSLLRALMAALGSNNASIKGDKETGRVVLTIEDTTYSRVLRRENGSIVTEGNPYLSDASLSDLFAFLLESNEARQAVARGDNLREIIMRPVDTDEIEEQISELQDQRSSIENEIEELEDLKRNIPGLEEQKNSIESSISRKRDKLAEIEHKIEKIDGEFGESIQEKEKLESRIEKLKNVRSEIEDVRHQIETQQNSIESLEKERGEIKNELEEVDTVSEDRLNQIDTELNRLRSQRAEIDATLNRLRSVIQFNEDLLEDDLDFFTNLQGDSDDGGDAEELTEQLLKEDTDDLVCWTCGSEVTTGQIESMLGSFRELRSKYMEQRSTIDEQIDDLQAEKSEIEEANQQHNTLNDRLSAIEDELAERRDSLPELKSRRDDLLDQVEELEADVEDLRSGENRSELISLHKEANELEVEIDRLENDLTEITTEIAQIEERIDKKGELETNLADVEAEIEERRTRIDRLERNAVSQFNEHMKTVLELLDYENLERIWLEQKEQEERQGRRKVCTTYFELHVVRSTSDGTVYEDSIDHLSESEREVTGLVFALAGYLAHDLHQECPFLVLDSVEAIDPQRIQALIGHFADYPEYLIVALLEDDASVIDDQYQRITDV